MTEPTTSRGAASSDAGSDDRGGYEGSGAWGTWALGLLLALFVLSAAAAVHSIVVTFTG